MAGIYVFTQSATGQTSYQYTVKSATGKSFTLNDVVVSATAASVVEWLDAGTTPTGGSVVGVTFEPIDAASNAIVIPSVTKGYAASDMASGTSKFKVNLGIGWNFQLTDNEVWRNRKYANGQQFTIKITSALTDLCINVNITEHAR